MGRRLSRGCHGHGPSHHWDLDTGGGVPTYASRLGKRPFGEAVTIDTELGRWSIETAGLPLYTAGDIRHG